MQILLRQWMDERKSNRSQSKKYLKMFNMRLKYNKLLKLSLMSTVQYIRTGLEKLTEKLHIGNKIEITRSKNKLRIIHLIDDLKSKQVICNRPIIDILII